MRHASAVAALLLVGVTACAASSPSAGSIVPTPTPSSALTAAAPRASSPDRTPRPAAEEPSPDVATTPMTTTSTTTTSMTTTSTTTTSTTTSTTIGAPTTSCANVAHIADSTGVYLWEPQYVDGTDNTMGERYRSVGVETWINDSSGGRSIRERHADWQTNALEAADAIRASGFRGCWVVMIGTNDAANVAAGANLGFDERILRLLFVFGDDPVLWVDAATNLTRTAYADDNMRAWNEALERIAAERDNVRVLRWSDRVRTDWFLADGVHMGTEGRIWRAAYTAAALAEEFPG